MVTKVVATRDGYYGGKLRKAGTHFNVDLDRHVSANWMAQEGCAKYRDFMRGFDADKNKRDDITGERLSAGGLAEQLAVQGEELRRKDAYVAELEAELAQLRPVGDAGGREKVETVTPAEEEQAAEGETSKPVRRRRQPKKD